MRAIWVVGRTDEAARRLALDAGLPEAAVFATTWDSLPASYPQLPGARFILVEWPAERAIALRTLPTLTHLTEVEIWAVVDDRRQAQVAVEAGISVPLCRPLNPTGVRRATDRLLQASVPKDAALPRHVREAREQRFSGLAALHRVLNEPQRLESLTACLAEGLADLLQAVTVVRILADAERPELVRGGGLWTGADLRMVGGPLPEQAMTQIDALGCDPAVLAAPGARGSVGHRLLLVPLVHTVGAVGVTLLRRELPFNRDEVACAELLAAQAAAAVARMTAAEVAEERMVTTLLRALETRDGATGRHSHRVADYTQALLAQCGVDADRPEWSDTIRGALLHDVGKIGVPDHALLAPGPLSAEQWQAVRQHAEASYHMLGAVDFLQGAAEVAYSHHERYDGSGYPRGLAGAEIPFGARIFAIADAFDAMTTDRPYRRARPPLAARSEIEQCAGTHFDPALVEIFCRTFDEIVRRMAA